MMECAFLLEPCYFLYDNFLSNLFSIGRPKAEEEATVHRLHAKKGREKSAATERKEERVKTIHDKDKGRSFTEKGDAWKRLKEKIMERWRRWRGIFCHRNERIGSTLCITITTCIYMPSLDTALSIYALEFSR